MLDLKRNEVNFLKAEANRLSRTLASFKVGTAKPNPAKIVRSAKKFANAAQIRTERLRTANHWQVVMLVTCVEAYLQDLLAAAASVGPELMSESKQLMLIRLFQQATISSI